MTQTKIICTLGPATSSYEKILELIDAGMNVARINFSHGTQKEHLLLIENLKEARSFKKTPLAIMADTKGTEIRLGAIKNNLIPVKAHQKLFISKKEIFPTEIFYSLQPEMTLLFDDGSILALILQIDEQGFEVEIQNDGILKSHKRITIPHSQFNLPLITQEDIEDIVFACQQGLDMIALSFVHSATQVREIQKLLASQGKNETLIIAKIENDLGVKNFDSILPIVDGVMVARGDLGVELPLEQVPHLQKMMIHQCARLSKPVIIATQMLESMIKCPRPTRAEVSDVANAIYDSASSVMLSGETAVGTYPIETVKMMKNIIFESEKEFSYQDFYAHAKQVFTDVPTSVAHAAVQTAYNTHAKAIFVVTHSGTTARLISRFRPQMPILALTLEEQVYHQMTLLWGVLPIKGEKIGSLQEAIDYLSFIALQHQWVRSGELIIVTAGVPLWIKGTTNTIMVKKLRPTKG